MNLANLLAMAGYTPKSAAQELARAGYGDAETLQIALKTGDKQALNFIPGEARAFRAQSPGLVGLAMSLLNTFLARAGRN